MMEPRLNTKRILIFLAFVFGISWAATLAFYLTGGMDNRVIRPDLAAVLWNYVFVVPAPALANVATRLITREGWRHLWLRPRFRRGWPFYLAVSLLPLLAAIVGSLAYCLFFPQSFDPSLSAARKDTSVPFPVAGIANPWMLMLSYALQYTILQGLLGGVISIGEEFGWRAYLLQRLTDRFRGANDAGIRTDGADGAAARKAALLVGAIWSVWHWPGLLIMMKLDPVTSVLYLLVYLVSTCSLSVLLSWATLRSGSVWPAALGHAAAIGAVRVGAAVLKGELDLLLGPGGLIGGIGFIVLALVLLFVRGAFAGQQKTPSESVPAVAITSPG